MSTFLFSATWQFNQFLLLLQAMALFTGQVLELLPLHKVSARSICLALKLPLTHKLHKFTSALKTWICAYHCCISGFRNNRIYESLTLWPFTCMRGQHNACPSSYVRVCARHQTRAQTLQYGDIQSEKCI